MFIQIQDGCWQRGRGREGREGRAKTLRKKVGATRTHGIRLRANVGNTQGVSTQCEGVVVAVLNACRPSPLTIILVEADSAGKKTQTLVCPLSMVSCATAPQKPPSGPVSKELSFDILFVCYFISFPLQYPFSLGLLFLKRLFTKPRHGFRRRAPRTHRTLISNTHGRGRFRVPDPVGQW